jgi:hemerythrin
MLIDKTNLPMVAKDDMNDVHLEDVDIINDLYELVLAYEKDFSEENKQKIDEQYQEWFKHTIVHFANEEEMMREKSFPPYPVHKGEHDNALSTMDRVFLSWQSTGDIQVLKGYLEEELPTWLVHHIQTMDTVTAMFLETGFSPCSAH